MAPDPDPDLRERVAELEATVEQQQATIEKLLPSRRRVLQAGGLVAGGGVLGALTADRASAQASGQVGTSSDPVDVEAFDLAVQNQLSSSVDAGGNDLTNVGSVNTNEIDTSRTWQDKVGSRDINTEYSNNTNGEIVFIATAAPSADSTRVNIQASPSDDKQDIVLDSGQAVSVRSIVPAGSTYQLLASGDTGSYSLELWNEFRP